MFALAAWFFRRLPVLGWLCPRAAGHDRWSGMLLLILYAANYFLPFVRS